MDGVYEMSEVVTDIMPGVSINLGQSTLESLGLFRNFVPGTLIVLATHTVSSTWAWTIAIQQILLADIATSCRHGSDTPRVEVVSKSFDIAGSVTVILFILVLVSFYQYARVPSVRRGTRGSCVRFS
jgi:hypothetical protein